jgi:RNA polymerase sigma-70 factor (sigma-E family)
VTFEAFVREHATSLLRTCFLLTGDMGSAEDLLQDTLMRLYPRWDKVMAATAPAAYVRRSITNEFLSSTRNLGARVVTLQLREDAAVAPDVVDAVSARDEVLRLLATVSPRQRAALVFRYYHAMNDAEIATILRCRQGTVRSLLSRALASLRGSTVAGESAANVTLGEAL